MTQLARQLEFAPHEVRAQQIEAAEELLYLIDPAKAYPLAFVIFRITGYHPKASAQELLTGIALQHDLGLLIESASESLDQRTCDLSQPVLAIDDVCERFNVTSKTIQRWRRKGLAARRFVFPDGKRRVGFLLSSVERFLLIHAEQVATTANVSQLTGDEQSEMLRRARRLATIGHCSPEEITRRVARVVNRSPLSVLHTIKKHDQEHCESPIFPLAATPVSHADRQNILKSRRRGTSLATLARLFARPRTEIYRITLDDRAARLAERRVRFYDDPLYHQPNAAQAIAAIVAQDELGLAQSREDLRIPRDLPPYLQDLYRTPLLTPSKERALFLKYNFHKFQFVQARRRLEPDRLKNRDLNLLESHLAAAARTKNEIVAANLRLVVSVARKHLRPNINLLELISDGNLTLMRAVDGFDMHRGHRFSTYATLALMKGFARSVPQMLSASRKSTGGAELCQSLPDSRPSAARHLFDRDEVAQLLSTLSDRERRVLAAHFGLDNDQGGTYDQVAQRLGLSKERVRQIEQVALAKLRASALS